MKIRTLKACLICLTLPLALLAPVDPALVSIAESQMIASPVHEIGLNPVEITYTPQTVHLPLIRRSGWIRAPLRNGGFEADWDDERSTDCLIFYTDGTIEATTRDNVLTPPGWLTWYRHGRPVDHDPDNGDGWQQPEVRDARHTDPPRMQSGEKGQLIFKTYGVFDAGFLQRVAVEAGQWVRLSGWAHAWSNNGGAPVDNGYDPRWSEGRRVGYNHFFALEGTDGLDGGELNFTFWLGLDPHGGTDPYADSVVWGSGAHIYNAYHPVPSVAVRAEGSAVTVFLRAQSLWRFRINDAYWDDILLETMQ